ncbi:MAG: hypothetical protein ACT4P5_23085, partial [Armatimonadota bacterium]
DCPNPRREVFTRASAPTAYDLTPVRSEANGDAALPGLAPLAITAPSDGALLTPPFIIEGTAPQGAMVTIVVVAEGAGGGARAAEVAMQTDASGRFAYEFRPAYRSSGTRYVIIVSALGLNGASVSRTIAVTDGAGPPSGR